MEKAYDLVELQKRAKEAGLPLAEAGAEILYQVVKTWLKDSAQVSSTPFDNMAMSFLDTLDGFVLPQIDKIDGQPG